MNPSEILMLLQGGDHFQEEDNSDFMPEMPFMMRTPQQYIARPQGDAHPQNAIRLQGGVRRGNHLQGGVRPQGDDRLQGLSALGNIPSQPARDSQGFVGVGSLYDGARAGMRSIRDLTNTSEEDQRRGIGMGLMRLFSGLSKTGYGSGIRGTLGALAQNIPEAMSSYTGHLDKKRNQNMEDLKAFMEEQNELREYNRKLLDMETQQNKWRHEQEEKRRHNLAQEDNWRKLASLKRPHGASLEKPELLAQFPGLADIPLMASKQEHSRYSRERHDLGELLSELDRIEEGWSKFRDLSKDDLIDPQTPYGVGTIANEIGDFVGTFGGNTKNKFFDAPKLRKQTEERKALGSLLGQFNAVLEKHLKGGTLTDSLRKHFETKELLPEMTDRADIFKRKLAQLRAPVDTRYKATTLALQTGHAISEQDMDLLYPVVRAGEHISSVAPTSHQTPSVNPYIDAVNGLSPEQLQQLQNQIDQEKAAEAQKGRHP